MTLGTSLVMIALGAILKFAVTWTVSGIDLRVVGLVLMVVGIIGLLLGLSFCRRIGARASVLGRPDEPEGASARVTVLGARRP